MGWFVWELLLKIFGLELAFAIFRLVAFTRRLSLGNFSLITVAFVWVLSLGIYRLIIFAWNYAVGELSLDSSRLGQAARWLELENWELELGEPTGPSWESPWGSISHCSLRC